MQEGFPTAGDCVSAKRRRSQQSSVSVPLSEDARYRPQAVPVSASAHYVFAQRAAGIRAACPFGLRAQGE